MGEVRKLPSVSFYDVLKSSVDNVSITTSTIKSIVSKKCFGFFNHDIFVYRSLVFKNKPYVTKEAYYNLNKKISETSVFDSTSTMFYDLDHIITNNQTLHCMDNAKAKPFDEVPKNSRKKSGFVANAESIVQECATHTPRIKPYKTVEQTRSKKRCASNHKSFSDIFLTDNPNMNDRREQKRSTIPMDSLRNKYHEECKSSSIETKHKNQYPGKTTDDPCHCQLFSYECPCENEKSLTQLASIGKSLKAKIDNNVSKIRNNDEDKSPVRKTYNTENALSGKKIMKVANFLNSNKPTAKSLRYNNTKITCPHCKEIIIIEDITEDQASNPKETAEVFEIELPNYSKTKLAFPNEASCTHNPPCELIRACQVFSSDFEFYNLKEKSLAGSKNNKRSIRVTKACRHHPPCTVVPSCQKIHVLKNKCEYIPPCLHRPRCINTPLCIPISKAHEYMLINEENYEDNSMEFKPMTRRNYGDITYNRVNQDNMNLQNAYEYLSEYSPRLAKHPKMDCISSTVLPVKIPLAKPYYNCKIAKSCQFDYKKQINSDKENGKEITDSDEIIYIRDVGCQFRNTTSNANNTSDRKNKAETNPTGYFNSSRESSGTATSSSYDINGNCPSHGTSDQVQKIAEWKKSKNNQRVFGSDIDSIIQYCLNYRDDDVALADTSSVLDSVKWLELSLPQVENKKRKNVFHIRRRKRKPYTKKIRRHFQM
ncbi:uncharacterized protein LOC121738505 [Aricia agestis]|uniref:uncharacterized protein LOC121738505 n=1 Tax=Aricia agestis TaxID=91739 RepID=UPI001C20531F|nr:uncharacterized protein LOC121738505 [Aricia agestis]